LQGKANPAPLLRQLNRITPCSKYSLDKGGKKVVLGWCWVFATLNQGKSGAGQII